MRLPGPRGAERSRPGVPERPLPAYSDPGSRILAGRSRRFLQAWPEADRQLRRGTEREADLGCHSCLGSFRAHVGRSRSWGSYPEADVRCPADLTARRSFQTFGRSGRGLDSRQGGLIRIDPTMRGSALHGTPADPLDTHDSERCPSGRKVVATSEDVLDGGEAGAVGKPLCATGSHGPCQP